MWVHAYKEISCLKKNKKPWAFSWVSVNSPQAMPRFPRSEAESCSPGSHYCSLSAVWQDEWSWAQCTHPRLHHRHIKAFSISAHLCSSTHISLLFKLLPPFTSPQRSRLSTCFRSMCVRSLKHFQVYSFAAVIEAVGISFSRRNTGKQWDKSTHRHLQSNVLHPWLYCRE